MQVGLLGRSSTMAAAVTGDFRAQPPDSDKTVLVMSAER